jgi:dihydrofolate reductase
MQNIRVSAIAAMSRNNVIGKDNALLWHISEDLKHFKKLTTGKPIIMGRKTYESLGKPLPNRTNIVVSRHKADLQGVVWLRSIDEAIAFAKTDAHNKGLDEIFIIGGGQIYKETLPRIERLYLTVVDREYEGDTYFPDWKAHEWHTVSKDHHDGDPAFTFFILERK